MTLRLIGAGLPRTGTSSLREALRLLLDAPVHHMSEVSVHPEQAAGWVAAITGRRVAWSELLAGYAAGVDVPFACCWRDLAAAHPDAPVLLSTRVDAETWYRSLAATVLPRTRELVARVDDPLAPLFGVILREVSDDLDDAEQLMAGYERWNAAVRAEVAPERLVEWQPGDGWEPLCSALGLDVPREPFPHENSTADYLARRASRERRDLERRGGSHRAT